MTDGQRAGTPPLTWADVLEAEYRALGGDAVIRQEDPAERLRVLHGLLHERRTAALCLSGGGIRSATFALGVLQGLAQVGVLDTVDYLSTVSGGGYTGGWFTTWLHREGDATGAGRSRVLRDLDPAQASARPRGEEAAPVRHVRLTCRYLAPGSGWLSADMWALLATLARNLLLNWLVILPLLAAALLVPRLYYAIVSAIESELVAGPCLAAGDPQVWLLGASIAGFSVAAGYTALNFIGFGARWPQTRFLGWFLLPLLLGAVTATLFWSAYPCDLSLGWALLLAAIIPASAWLVLPALTDRRDDGDRAAAGGMLRITGGIRPVLAALASGPVLGAGAYWFATYPFGFGDGAPLRELYAVAAVPIVLMLVGVTIALFVGLASPALDDAALEWWSRCAGWIAIAATVWLAAGVLVFYMADLLEAALRRVDAALHLHDQTAAATFSTLAPLLASLAALVWAWSRPGVNRFVILAQRLALPLIIVLLLSSLAWVNQRVLESLEYHRTADATLCSGALVGHDAGCHPAAAGVGELALYGLGLVVFGLAMSRVVPTNRFSLHGMYRQRLIRTFLGASRAERAPNQFTGFDGRDDLPVHALTDVRPLHVINATLNAVTSAHTGRHESRAESFTFSPLHVGNQTVGYRPASAYGSDGGAAGTGLSLGMALAVSGAAASPAMGIYSSAARAFLLTLANARLGLWFGNPQNASTWTLSDPPLGIGPLVRELLGLTTDRNPYVYLSDGGHYDNLGLWEMVARRCRFVVVSDAGCDPNYRFTDLSNAVRRIRLDLGIPITFPPLAITREGQGRTNPHATVGTIRYSVVDGAGAPDGTLLLLKATLSGDEPVDVWNFAQADPSFPHDSTSEQFFDEAKFESYRTLGFHSVLSVAQGFDGAGGLGGLCTTAATLLTAPETGPDAGRAVAELLIGISEGMPRRSGG